jgi:hypothetical protein
MKIYIRCGAIIFIVFAIFLAISLHHSKPIYPQTLDVMAMIKPDTEFHIYRRLLKNNLWDDGSPYSKNNAIALIEATKAAKPWADAIRAEGFRGMCVRPPEFTIILAWCKDINDETSDKYSLAICYGNIVFKYNHKLYQLSEDGQKVFNRIFPDNIQGWRKDGEKRCQGRKDVRNR